MNFGQALELVKSGHRVSRANWNGKGMFIFLNRGSSSEAPSQLPPLIGGVRSSMFEYGNKGTLVKMPSISLRAADDSIVPGWLASQTDMLAEDWQIA